MIFYICITTIQNLTDMSRLVNITTHAGLVYNST